MGQELIFLGTVIIYFSGAFFLVLALFYGGLHIVHKFFEVPLGPAILITLVSTFWLCGMVLIFVGNLM